MGTELITLNNNTKVWLTIEEVCDLEGKHVGYATYWGYKKPSSILLGESIKNEEGKTILFPNHDIANTYAVDLLNNILGT